MQKKKKFVPQITVIIHDHCFNELQGTESMQYIVENRINDEWGNGNNEKIFETLPSAYKYAETLHKKYSTKDIIEIYC